MRFSKRFFLLGGFTLLELMIVVTIITVLSATAIPALTKYMRRAKTTEAKTNIRKIYDGEISYWNEEYVNAQGKTLSPRFVGCDPTPSFPPTTQKRLGNWNSTNWVLLKFGTDSPVLYSYMVDTPTYGGVIPRPAGVPNLPDPQPDWIDGFVARALGDTDGDGKFSLFERLAIATTKTGEPEGVAGVFVWDELE